jgi:GntR family transcriptional repressor for pyruvate dehydrogenase complex
MNSPAPIHDPADRIRRLIVERGLSPGDRLPSVRDLARTWNATLVEVREALAQAKRSGLIDTRPRSGAYVRDAMPHLPSDGDSSGVRVVDRHQLYLCQARAVLEVELAAAAAEHRTQHDLTAMRSALNDWLRISADGLHEEAVEPDTRFHLAIADAAGNPVLTGLLQQCLRRQLMYECGLPMQPADARRIGSIHKRLYQAIHDRDADAARRAARQHMQHLDRCIRAMIDSAAPQARNSARRRSPRSTTP